MGTRVAIRERREIGARGPGERVDRLVLVADDAQVGAVAEPQLEQPLLERVRVLILVDAEPALARTDSGGGLRVAFEEIDGADQQVVEVDPIRACLRAFVAGEDLDEQVDRDGRLTAGLGGAAGDGALVGRRREPPALGPLDLVGQVLGRGEPVVAGQAASDRHDERQLGVEQVGQRLVVVMRRPEVAQLAQRMGMEGAGRDPGQPEAAQPLDHLARRLVREGDHEDLVGRDDVGRDGVGRAMTDDPGLARARAGEDADRTARREDGFALGIVEVGEEALRFWDGHVPSMTPGGAPARIQRHRPVRVPAGYAADRYRRSMTPPLDEAGLLEGVEALVAIDPDLAGIAERHGPPPLWAREPGFDTLVRIILEQQVSLASGEAAHRRLLAAAGAVEPEAVVAVGEDRLREAGLTRQKARYLILLATDLLDGRVDLAAIATADDDEARRRLTAIVGIGRWTADIYLLMALGRPDIWPTGDLALAGAMRRAKRLETLPTSARPAGGRRRLAPLAGGGRAPPLARLPRRRTLTRRRRSVYAVGKDRAMIASRSSRVGAGS